MLSNFSLKLWGICGSDKGCSSYCSELGRVLEPQLRNLDSPSVLPVKNLPQTGNVLAKPGCLGSACESGSYRNFAGLGSIQN